MCACLLPSSARLNSLKGGLIIEEIFLEGNAYRDGRLYPGDRIVAVDDDDITGRSLAEATLLLSTPVPLMKLMVIRDGGESNPRPLPPQHTPTNTHSYKINSLCGHT